MVATITLLACTIHDDGLWLSQWLDRKWPRIKGFQPEWCISTIYHAWDKPSICKNLTKNGEPQRYTWERRRRRRKKNGLISLICLRITCLVCCLSRKGDEQNRNESKFVQLPAFVVVLFCHLGICYLRTTNTDLQSLLVFVTLPRCYITDAGRTDCSKFPATCLPETM